MTQPHVEEFVIKRNRRFRWDAFLPKRKAWLQTLILLPFGLPVGNFLGYSWNFSVNLIAEEHQYLAGVLSMTFNLLLPSLFFAFLLHWIASISKQESSTWYPQSQGLWAGCYATLTLAASFGMVALFTHTLAVCGNPVWGSVSQTLLCNLDNYGFESKSWFGAWFIIAAYCYQAKGSIESICERIFHRRDDRIRSAHSNFTVATADGDSSRHEDAIANPEETSPSNHLTVDS